METNLRQIRKEKNMTLMELSKKTGISAGYLSHLERGTRENPTLITLSIIAKVLNTQVEDIFNINEE